MRPLPIACVAFSDVNGIDPVTKIVPTFWPFSYHHHGEVRAVVDTEHGGPNALYDHSIVNYAEILSEGSGR